MEIIVCKFGGACTADAEGFRRILELLTGDDRRRYAVLSAPGRTQGQSKITDLLCDLWQADPDSRAAERIVKAIIGRFSRIASSLGIPFGAGEASFILHKARRTSKATLLSRGEAFCAVSFARYAGIPMVDAAQCISFDASGRLDEPATLLRFADMARRLPRAVIPGFYGSAPDGSIVTFPRNGSDISGALCAAGVKASVYENWTDVPGLMTADPESDSDAQLIPEISYPAMRALADAGARVLHADCLGPVARAGIPTRIRDIRHPEAPGTWVL